MFSVRPEFLTVVPLFSQPVSVGYRLGYTQMMSKYHAQGNKEGIHFIPIVVDTISALHPHALQVIKRLSIQAAVAVMGLESDIVSGSLLARVKSTGGEGVMFSVPKIPPLFRKRSQK